MIDVFAIPAFSDNYIWLITHKASKHCYLVDPGDADVCIKEIEQRNLTLAGILITHHHADHVGGLKALIQYARTCGTELKVYGGKISKVSGITEKVDNEDHFTLFDDVTVKVLTVPGHTLDHIAFYIEPALFCGDTLFSGGCGRLFEGSAEQMFNSLQKINALPASTKIYCAHEYTLANLAFAAVVEPDNEAIINYQQQVKKLRTQGQASIPSDLATELAINPFLRTDKYSIKTRVTTHFAESSATDVETFALLRRWKDKF